MFHIFLHFAVPFIVAKVSTGMAKGQNWWRLWLIMMATMLVDIDHLLATPIYDPMRCSIGFHPLHQWPAILIYMLACAFPKTRWVGIGLIIHMALDSIDCKVNLGIWFI